jgi:hypothetical protein
MTAPSAPVIRARTNGTTVRILWQPVPNATDYTLYESDESFVTVLAEAFSALGEADTDLLTTAGHGLAAGDSIVFTSLTGGTGLVTGTTYYIIATGLTANDFEVSLTKAGAAVDFSTDVTASSWHLVLPPAYLAVESIDASAEGDDGWFQATFVPENTVPYLVLSAFNSGDEESSPSNELRLDLSGGGGKSFGSADPNKDARNTVDPFGAY